VALIPDGFLPDAKQAGQDAPVEHAHVEFAGVVLQQVHAAADGTGL